MAARAAAEPAKAIASSPSSSAMTGSVGPSARRPRKVGAMISACAAASTRREIPSCVHGAVGAAAMRREILSSSHSAFSRTSWGWSPATMMP